MGSGSRSVKSIVEIDHCTLYVIFRIGAVRVDRNLKGGFPARARELHGTSRRCIGGRSDDDSLACRSGAAGGVGGGQHDVKPARGGICMRATRPLRTSSIAPVNYHTHYVILGIATVTIRTYGKTHRTTPWRYAQRASGRHVRITYSNRMGRGPSISG